jgi:prepilin-type N-terminal cleavage/methylation domain-containing protein
MRRTGFTLIEFLIVAVLIAVFAFLAIDPDPRYTVMAKAREALGRFETIKPQIASHYRRTKGWPTRNQQVAIPEDGFLESKTYSFHLQADGSVLVRISQGSLSLRPAVDPQGDVRWVCGNAQPAPGYTVVGANRTTLTRDGRQLPKECDDR